MTNTGKKTPEGIGREMAMAVKINCREEGKSFVMIVICMTVEWGHLCHMTITSTITSNLKCLFFGYTSNAVH